MNQDKLQTIAKRHIQALEKMQIMQIICKLCSLIKMRLNSKSEYLIVSKGTIFVVLGELGLDQL